jgi:hypothetical protein
MPRRNIRFPHQKGERRASMSSDVSDATSEPSNPSNGRVSKQTTIPEEVSLTLDGLVSCN